MGTMWASCSDPTASKCPSAAKTAHGQGSACCGRGILYAAFNLPSFCHHLIKLHLVYHRQAYWPTKEDWICRNWPKEYEKGYFSIICPTSQCSKELRGAWMTAFLWSWHIKRKSFKKLAIDKVTCLIPLHIGEKENWLSSQLPYQTDPWGWTATSGRVGGHRRGTVEISMPGTVVILLCSHNKLFRKREREYQEAFVGQT